MQRPTIPPVHGDVDLDIAHDKAIRAFTVEWTWAARDEATVHGPCRRRITLYLEEHHGQWEVVGHQPRGMGDAQ